MNRIIILVLFIVINIRVEVSGQNPLHLGAGPTVAGTDQTIADNPAAGWGGPSLKVFDGKAYMVVSRMDDPNASSFSNPNWSIFSSVDLRTWTKEIDIQPADVSVSPSGAKRCWASDLSQKDGVFYFYYSWGSSLLGGVKINATAGNWSITPGTSVVLCQGDNPADMDHDPTVFFDNAFPFMLYGVDGMVTDAITNNLRAQRYQIAKLNPLMLSIANNGTNINGITLLAEHSPPNGLGTPVQAKDHSYIHSYNNKYYVSTAGSYLISDVDKYGPYYGRNTGTVYVPFGVGPNNTTTAGHSSFAEYNEQWYHCWEYSFKRPSRHFNQVHLTYLHYRDNGEMVDDIAFLDTLDRGSYGPDFGAHYGTGVGQYSANWNKIEAEWFFKKAGNLVKKERTGNGFELVSIKNNDQVVFPKVQAITANDVVYVSLSSNNLGGSIEVHQNTPTGTILGQAAIPNTGGYNIYSILPITLTNVAGPKDLCFVFKGAAADICHFDFFTFQSNVQAINAQAFSAKQNTDAIAKIQQPLKQGPVITLYPNPANESVTIQLNSEQVQTVRIYTTNGKLVFSKSAVKGQLNVQTRDIGTTGVYIVKTDSGGSSKLIISK